MWPLLILPLLAPPQQHEIPLRTKISITAVGITAGIDLGVTEYYIGKGILRELNPLLRRYERAPVKMGAFKSILGAAEIWILRLVEHRDPLWTFITSVAISGFNTWAIIHNVREAKK